MSYHFRQWLAIAGLVVLAAGLVAGGMVYRKEVTGAYRKLVGREAAATTQPELLYTCAMHPQVIQDHPGRCPICGMELVPLKPGLMDSRTLAIDPVMVQNMGVRVAEAKRGELLRTIRMVGTFTEPEQNHVEVNLRVSGWVEKLYANTENMEVKKGDKLFDLYSPEITAAADELIAAKKFGTDAGDAEKMAESVVAAACRKLELMGVDEGQINEIAKMDKAPRTVAFYSPITGHTTEMTVVQGAAVKAGDKVMKIADRTSMWLLVQVYEQDLRSVQVGAKVRTVVDAFPGEVFEGTVNFLYPHLDMMNRTATVRVIFANHDHRLHEGMYASATMEAVAAANAVIVPREAVIDSGSRQVVFVMDEQEGPGHFALREVVIGANGSVDCAEMVEVLSGLESGEKVVTSGQFLLDSESRRQEAIQKYLRTRLATTQGATTHVAADPRIDGVVNAYLDVADYLGATDTGPAAEAAVFEKAAKELAGSTQGKEKELAEGLAQEAGAMKGATIEQQREHFKTASTAMISLVEQFGATEAVGGTLYEFHCGMAKANWLQRTEKKSNPFYDNKMKDCGDLVRKIFTTPLPAAPPLPHAGKTGGGK